MQTLIREFEYGDLPGQVTFSNAGKIHVDRRPGVLPHLALRRDPDTGLYSTAPAGHWAATPLVSGTRILQLLALDLDLDRELPEGTFVDFRVGDGAADRYWDGADWTPATLDAHWNTLAAARDNLPAFPLPPAPAYRLVLRLRTEDARLSPRVRGVRVAYRTDVDLVEDLLNDGLMAYLRAAHASADLLVRGNGTAEVSVKTPDTANFDIRDVESVYNHALDPGHRSNLRAGYASATGQLALSTAPPLSADLRVRFLYSPRAYFAPGQDVPAEALAGKVPAVVLEDYHPGPGGGQMPGRGQLVRNVDAGTAIFFPPPRRTDYRGVLLIFAAGTRELHRLQMRLLEQFDRNPILTGPGTGEQVTIRITRDADSLPRVGVTEVRGARLEFQMDNVQVYTRPAEDVILVQRFTPSAGNVPPGDVE